MLPAVLVVFGVEDLLFVLLGGDVALPLLLTVAVLPAHPAVKVHLQHKEDTHRVSSCCLGGPWWVTRVQVPDWLKTTPPKAHFLLLGSPSSGERWARGPGTLWQEVSLPTRVSVGRMGGQVQTRVPGRINTMRKIREAAKAPGSPAVQDQGAVTPLLHMNGAPTAGQHLCRGRGSTRAGKTPPRGHRPTNFSRNPVLPQMQACGVWAGLPKCPGSESGVTLAKNRFTEGLPWRLRGYDLVLPMQGTWVWSLVGEPGPHMLCSAGERGGGVERTGSQRQVTLTTQQVGVTLLWKPRQYLRKGDETLCAEPGHRGQSPQGSWWAETCPWPGSDWLNSERGQKDQLETRSRVNAYVCVSLKNHAGQKYRLAIDSPRYGDSAWKKTTLVWSLREGWQLGFQPHLWHFIHPTEANMANLTSVEWGWLAQDTLYINPFTFLKHVKASPVKHHRWLMSGWNPETEVRPQEDDKGTRGLGAGWALPGWSSG